MTSKPSSSAGYSNQGLDRVRQVCLYMATKLGDLLEEIVVVGGLVPYLLVDQDNLPAGATPHVGTMDLDMGLALAMLNQERYRELGSRLRDAGFEPEINAEGNRRLQSWTTGPPYHVTVDFLIPPNDETDVGGGILHLDSDLAAIVTPGLELAFKDRQWKELSGPVPSGASATRSIPSCGPGAFTVLKALAFGSRAENKDAYDLYYVWNAVGIPAVAESVASLAPDVHIDSALKVIEQDFCDHGGLGPIATARFMSQGTDDDIQADVVGYATALLRSMGRA